MWVASTVHGAPGHSFGRSMCAGDMRGGANRRKTPSFLCGQHRSAAPRAARRAAAEDSLRIDAVVGRPTRRRQAAWCSKRTRMTTPNASRRRPAVSASSWPTRPRPRSGGRACRTEMPAAIAWRRPRFDDRQRAAALDVEAPSSSVAKPPRRPQRDLPVGHGAREPRGGSPGARAPRAAPPPAAGDVSPPTTWRKSNDTAARTRWERSGYSRRTRTRIAPPARRVMRHAGLRASTSAASSPKPQRARPAFTSFASARRRRRRRGRRGRRRRARCPGRRRASARAGRRCRAPSTPTRPAPARGGPGRSR